MSTFPEVREALALVREHQSPTMARLQARTLLTSVTPPKVLRQMLDELDAAQAEVLVLHKQLAEAKRDAEAAWSRWKNAARSANDLMSEKSYSYAARPSDFRVVATNHGLRTSYVMYLGGSATAAMEAMIEERGDYLEVESITVWDKVNRKRGLGRYLLALIQNHTLAELRLDSSDGATGFYTALGFTEMGNKRYYRKYSPTRLGGR